MSSAPQLLAVNYSRAWADRDPDSITEMHTDDSVFHLHNVADPVSGRVAIRQAIASLFAQSPDLSFVHRRIFFGTEHFVSEYEMNGTADAKSFACDGVDVFSLRDGRIARKDTYIDWLTYQSQVGRMPSFA